MKEWERTFVRYEDESQVECYLKRERDEFNELPEGVRLVLSTVMVDGEDRIFMRLSQESELDLVL